jgi:hypothetical protein
VRLIVATHPATSTHKPSIGVLRAQTVYELFVTTLPPQAFTCADVLDLYLHRGAFETVLSDEDREQDEDSLVFPHRLWEGDSGRFSANGSGIFVWSSESSSRLLPCV